MNPNLNFNEISKWFICTTLKFEKPLPLGPADHSDLSSLGCVAVCTRGRIVSGGPAKSHTAWVQDQRGVTLDKLPRALSIICVKSEH